jgi:nuclear pore complex protein Nup62
MLATDLHTHLDDLSGSLTEMIESVNSLSISSNPSESADDPMTQIAQILSSHLESLQWIDVAVREVESKTVDVEKRVRESGHNLSNSGTKARGFGLNYCHTSSAIMFVK